MIVQQDSLLIRYMANRMLMDVSENTMIAQFQVGYVSFSNLKLHKTFREKVENVLALYLMEIH